MIDKCRERLDGTYQVTWLVEGLRWPWHVKVFIPDPELLPKHSRVMQKLLAASVFSSPHAQAHYTLRDLKIKVTEVSKNLRR